eukprot:6173902-Pleurochrysis_carterae.AAC.2
MKGQAEDSARQELSKAGRESFNCEHAFSARSCCARLRLLLAERGLHPVDGHLAQLPRVGREEQRHVRGEGLLCARWARECGLRTRARERKPHGRAMRAISGPTAAPLNNRA